MKSRNVVCLTIIIMLMAAFSAFGENIWQPENVDPDLEEARWLGDPDYWSQGRFPEGSDSVFIESPVTTCILDGAVEGTNRLLIQGDPNSMLIVADGGSIEQTSDGGWNGINAPGGTLIIEDGGSVSVQSHWWNGIHGGADGSTLILNGGEMWGAHAFDMGRAGGGACYTYLNDGVLNVRYLPGLGDSWMANESVMDISFGTFIVRSTGAEGPINDLIDIGGIVAFGGTGTVEVEVDEDWVIVTAVSPMEPSPTYRELVRAGDVDLQWTNLEGADMVDVWFGDDPDNLTQVVTGEDVSSVQVNAPVVTEPTTYYWRIDTYIDDELMEGTILRFDVTENLPPEISITTPRMISWAGEPIQLETEVVHDDPESLTYSWEATTPEGDPLEEPAVFEPGDDVANPTITVNYHASIFRVTVAVDDGINEPVTATRLLDVADNPCQAARALGIGDDYPADIAANCIHDLEDYAEIASEWLVDFIITEPVAMPEEE